MITKIIAVGDIHIRNLKRNEEYQEKLTEFVKKCKEIVKKNGKASTRIVIAGDLLHNKTDISPEGYAVASWFLGELDKVCDVIIFAGNHDMSQNTQRLDPITSIVSMCKFKHVHYLDMETDYCSGCVVDDNVVWCLYSSFDNFTEPGISEYRIQNPDYTYVSLYHGDVKGAKTDTGYSSGTGMEASYFDGSDFAILGHIHKRQCIKYNGIPLVYCGSLIQQDFGENISKHGFVVWDVEKRTYEEVDMEDTEYGFYTFSVNSEDDIDEDNEELINF